MCESEKVKYLIYKHHLRNESTEASNVLIIYSHVTLRDLRPALCLHMLKGSHAAPHSVSHQRALLFHPQPAPFRRFHMFIFSFDLMSDDFQASVSLRCHL